MWISLGSMTRRIASGVLLLAAAAVAQPPPLPAEEQTQIQAAVSKLVSAINRRDFDAVRAATTPDFDAWVPGGGFWNLARLKNGPPPANAKFEIAALVRILRMLTPDAAFGDGFFRTINLAGGESSGRLYVALVKKNGRWLVSLARFTPRRGTEPGYIPVEPAKEQTAPGADGWITLFDGASTAAFVRPSGAEFPSNSWVITPDKLLKAVAGNQMSGFRTKDTFRSFEMRFSWKVPPKGNSGIKYRLYYMSAGDGAGHEYQLADDNGDPGAKEFPVERSGALYNQIAPSKSMVKPVGDWNESTIIVRGRHCEHWLNGEKVVEYETDSSPLESPILFQHHTTEAWFRDIRIRRLD